jgi:hypothetical protein
MVIRKKQVKEEHVAFLHLLTYTDPYVQANLGIQVEYVDCDKRVRICKSSVVDL